ncbi:DUF1176 domain-containing protein [Coralloluteibacterium stylophorae]|uniref:DUF1176 domain-containing protein n=1 Tax=Coralloluteibacterium stylophorae TaxID=1776034 RepID=A0A8J7VV43_9GAMM|nr:DUF1176 domain-containing protein [Coralloluteibacterium stylophorae]MBS7456234.1 DUF1176 domain-containing protein [Coralloluteibacterium stylophorae]
MPVASRAAALLLACAAAAPAAAAEPVYRSFGDWVVGCDNTRRCELLNLGSDTAWGLDLTLALDAGPDAAPELALATEDVLEGRLWLDGVLLPQDTIAPGPAAVLRGDAALHLVDAIRDGSRLATGPGPEAPAASLAGLSAALLLVDEVQGRLGTRTALLRRGTAPAAQVPAAPPLPPAPRAAAAAPPLDESEAGGLVAAVREASATDLEAEGCFVDAGEAWDQAVALDADGVLVLLECWRGAYQGSSVIYRVPRAAPDAARRVVLELPLPATTADRRVDAFTSAGYDPATATLSHVARGRGLADCGIAAHWIFDGDAFRLASLAYLDRCGRVEPGAWPVLWRTQAPGAE